MPLLLQSLLALKLLPLKLLSLLTQTSLKLTSFRLEPLALALLPLSFELQLAQTLLVLVLSIVRNRRIRRHIDRRPIVVVIGARLIVGLAIRLVVVLIVAWVPVTGVIAIIWQIR